MNRTIKIFDSKTADYFIVKKKEGYKYYNILRCKNNIFNRMLLLFKRFDSFNELYIIPEFDGIEGFYYKFM